jgi:phosphoacetylglucosamine mutase
MASPEVKKAIAEAASQYAKPEGKVFQYGTAGVGDFATPALQHLELEANGILALCSSV